LPGRSKNNTACGLPVLARDLRHLSCQQFASSSRSERAQDANSQCNIKTRAQTRHTASNLDCAASSTDMRATNSGLKGPLCDGAMQSMMKLTALQLHPSDPQVARLAHRQLQCVLTGISLMGANWLTAGVTPDCPALQWQWRPLPSICLTGLSVHEWT